MFAREKPNKSRLISVQVTDKSRGRYEVVKTIDSSIDSLEINRLVLQGKWFIEESEGVQQIDITDYKKKYSEVLSSISTRKLVGHSRYLLNKVR